MVVLSRLHVLTTLDSSTPRVVLVDILQAHGIKLPSNMTTVTSNMLIDIILSTPVITLPQLTLVRPALAATSTLTSHIVPTQWTDAQWPYICRYINTTCSWTKRSAVAAWTHIWTFYMQPPTLFQLPLTFDIGPLTTTTVHSYNATMLYALCQQCQLVTTAESTLEDMYRMLQLYRLPRADIITRLSRQLSSVPTASLVAWLCHSTDRHSGHHKTVAVDTVDYSHVNALDQTTNVSKCIGTDAVATQLHWADIEDVALKLYGQPRPSSVDSVTDAIACACVYFSCDLTVMVASTPHSHDNTNKDTNNDTSNNTILDNYSKLVTYGRERYLRRLRQTYSGGSSVDVADVDMYTSFKPQLPMACYNRTCLLTLCRSTWPDNDSVTAMSDDDMYDALMLEAAADTFYVHHGCNSHNSHNTYSTCAHNTHTYITYEDIQTLPPDTVIKYGPQLGPHHVYTCDELTQCFRHYRNFVQVHAPTVALTATAINKLAKIVADKIAEKLAQAEDVCMWRQLHASMTNIHELEVARADDRRQLVDAYATYSKIIDTFLWALHRLAMTLRGWDGHGPLPIETAPIPHLETVEIRTTLALDDVITGAAAAPWLLTLPLMRYSTKGKFLVSTDVTEAINIGQRLDMIKQGQTTTNLTSCIRVSSNWLAATSYYYLQLVGQVLPYDISTLTNIT